MKENNEKLIRGQPNILNKTYLHPYLTCFIHLDWTVSWHPTM